MGVEGPICSLLLNTRDSEIAGAEPMFNHLKEQKAQDRKATKDLDICTSSLWCPESDMQLPCAWRCVSRTVCHFSYREAAATGTPRLCNRSKTSGTSGYSRMFWPRLSRTVPSLERVTHAQLPPSPS